jgi:hypothetical protein
MPQPLDQTRCEDTREELRPPDGFVDSDKFIELVEAAAEQSLEPLIYVLGEDRVEWGGLLDDAYVTLTLPVLPVSIGCEWQHGIDTYYDPDVVYDPRSDVLFHLRNIWEHLEADIRERPLDRRVVTAAMQRESDA